MYVFPKISCSDQKGHRPEEAQGAFHTSLTPPIQGWNTPLFPQVRGVPYKPHSAYTGMEHSNIPSGERCPIPASLRLYRDGTL